MTNHSSRSRRSFLKSAAQPLQSCWARRSPSRKQKRSRIPSIRQARARLLRGTIWARTRGFLFPCGTFPGSSRSIPAVLTRTRTTSGRGCGARLQHLTRGLLSQPDFGARVDISKAELEAGVNLPMWGEIAADHTCNVRKEVARLADLCRKHDIWLGLDSWDKPHMFWSTRLPFIESTGAPSILFGLPFSTRIPEGKEEQAFTAYGEIWVRALKFMREDGVLERAVWIAPMNEVPHFCGRSVATVDAIEHKPRNEGETSSRLRRN